MTKGYIFQTDSFKNKKATNNYNKRRQPFVQQCFLKLCIKFWGKWASSAGTGARGIWQLMIFTFFAFGSPLNFSWHSSFNLARSTCSFYWCYIFLLNIRDLKISIKEEKHMHSIAIGYWSKISQNSQENICNKVLFLVNFLNVRLHCWCVLASFAKLLQQFF